MDGLAYVAGMTGAQLEIGGTVYTLRPRVIGVYAEMEAYLLSLRPNPMALAAEAAASAPLEQHPAIWAAAFDAMRKSRIVAAVEASLFEQSLQGLAWRLWTAVREDHPAIDSPDRALELIEVLGPARLDELRTALDRVGGEADLKNCAGRPRTAAVGATNASPGRPSTPGSLVSTAGRPDKSTS